jgi:uncharacterized phage-associated protein
MTTVFQVADYFLAKSDTSDGDRITHLKLQKLVYYAQGFTIAILDRPLFEELIMAWKHGPVCEALYNKYKNFGTEPLDVIYSTKRSKDKAIKDASKPFNKKELEIIDEVINIYGQYTASRLRETTHETPPWYMTRPNSVITKASMKKFFVTQVIEK